MRIKTLSCLICALLVWQAAAYADPIEPMVRLEFPYPLTLLSKFQYNEGDVNNDGYNDLIIGDYRAPVNDSMTGVAYLFLGGEDFDSQPDLIFTGDPYYPPQPESRFGYVVEIAGDLNNDGFDDIVITDYNYSTQYHYYLGRVYIYYGGPVMDTTADVILEGWHYHQYFGSYMSAPGDVNGDGYDDLTVCSAYGPSGYAKAWYLYLGGDPFPTQYYFELYANRNIDQLFGTYGNRRVDVNVDGFNDIIAYDEPDPNSWDYYTYIFLGSQTPDTVVDFTFPGVRMSVVDVNGDDIDDVSTGIYYYFAGEYFDINPDHRVIELCHYSNGCGDLNFDGYNDFLTGNRSTDSVHFYFGGNPPDSQASYEVSLTGLGKQMPLLGDIDGDNWPEILLRYDVNDTHQVWIYKTRPFQVETDLALKMTAGQLPVVTWPGESFTFSGQLLNADTARASVDLWLEVRTPRNLYIDFRQWHDIILQPYQIVSVSNITQSVPNTAKCGEYSLISYCGRYPDEIVDSAFIWVSVQCQPSWDQSGTIPGAPEIQLKAYPNPFNATTTISFDLPVSGNVRLEVYNIIGRLVEMLVDENLDAGRHNIEWDASALSSGVYFYKLNADGNILTKRMTLLK